MSDRTDKVMKLLAQAEGASTPEEAALYTERAQHIASTYAINMELVRHNQANKEAREEPTHKRITTGEDGRTHANRFNVDLFLSIARANDLKCTIAHDRANVNVYGYPSDIEMTEILFTSLATQMVTTADRSLRNGEHRAQGVHGKTWRSNWYEGFGSQIGTRLSRAKNDAMREQREREAATLAELEKFLAPAASAEPAADAADVPVTGELVMIRKAEAVNDYYAKNTGYLRGSYRSGGAGTKHYGARAAGSNAANRASLGGSSALAGGGRAIGR